MLSGEGSDELFGGYPKYRLRPAVAAARGPCRARCVGAAAVRVGSLGPRPRLARAGSRCGPPGPPTSASAAAWFAPFTDAERRALLGRGAARDSRTPGRPRAVDAIRRDAAAHDCGAWLADNLLERGDRMSMAASLELRPPFLDHRLVELAFRLPSSVKVARRHGKWVLKRGGARLPARPTIVDRRKAGFRVPLDAWFRGGLRDMAWDRLTATASFVGRLFDRDAVGGCSSVTNGAAPTRRAGSGR